MQLEIKRQAEEIAREYIERNIQEIMAAYCGLATGKAVKVGKRRLRLTIDPATTRDAVGKFLPAAKQEIELSAGIKIVRIDAFKPE